MDDDPVLRELSADLERDDPRLAALLSGTPAPARRHRRLPWLLAMSAVLVFAMTVPPTVFLGVTTMIAVVCSPLVVCRWCAGQDLPPPRHD